MCIDVGQIQLVIGDGQDSMKIAWLPRDQSRSFDIWIFAAWLRLMLAS